MSSGQNEQDLAPDPDFRPSDVRLIGDIESLRAISDPTRLRILETMVQRQDPAWSVKELAGEIGVPQTRLYHHIEQLLERDLIRPVERRIVSGIIETRYRVAALSFQLDRGLLAGDTEAGQQALHDTLVAVFDTARGEIEQAIREGVIDPTAEASDDHKVVLSRGLARLSPARAAELRERLKTLHEEFGSDDLPDGQAFGLVFALYPMPRPGGDGGTDDGPEGASR